MAVSAKDVPILLNHGAEASKERNEVYKLHARACARVGVEKEDCGIQTHDGMHQ